MPCVKLNWPAFECTLNLRISIYLSVYLSIHSDIPPIPPLIFAGGGRKVRNLASNEARWFQREATKSEI